jgi:RNA polymerase sigma-70 factor (family 1)
LFVQKTGDFYPYAPLIFCSPAKAGLCMNCPQLSKAYCLPLDFSQTLQIILDPASSYNDHELFLGIAGGDETCFRALFERYKQKLYFFLLKVVRNEADAEELVQEVFMRIWISRFALGKVENPASYIFITARNRALDLLIKGLKDEGLKTHLYHHSENSGNETEETILFRESRELIDRAVQTLPVQQKLVYELSRHQGSSREEIAQALQLSQNTVRNHLAAAIKSIREFLEEHHQYCVLPFLLGILK